MRVQIAYKSARLSLALVLLASIAWGCAPVPSEPTSGPAEVSPVPPDEGGSEPEPAEEVVVTGPIEARDVALAYLSEIDPANAPAADSAWAEESITPEGLVGAEGRRYTSGEWTVTVAYAVTSVEQVLYAITVNNQATGSEWEADVDAYGEVIEFGSAEEPVEPAPSTPSSGLPEPSQVPATSAGAARISELVRGNNAFALALYEALRSSERNTFFSPYSISAALAMTYAGARGETEAQMAKVLRFFLPQADLHPSFQALAAELEKRGEGAKGSDGEGFRLNIANALWGQESYSFLENYLELLSAYYGAGMERVDFSKAEEARGLINDWASRKTEERIQDLIPQGGVNELTRLVLANAVYFNAAWATQFDEALTEEGGFTRLDATQVQVPMMSQTESLNYAVDGGFLAVELPYDGRELSMVIVLPEPGMLDVYDRPLSAETVERLLAGLAPEQVKLTMPKFEFDAQFSLRETLSEMGMPIAFSADADLTGMAAERELFITDVFHKAFVKVDENGTEAAAATAVVVGLTAFNPVEPIEVRVDRPFVFLIRDVKTGTILFLGRVVDPSL
ncbi:MAG TPA: serpin family protein [Anaerolineae bacterium]|nr:serpin family protein [Anaerolineae bacterium]